MRTLNSIANKSVLNDIRTNPIIDNAAPEIICEWNMNRMHSAVGYNDVGGGDDYYSISVPQIERNLIKQDYRYAQKFANSWRETNNLRMLRVFRSTTNDKAKWEFPRYAEEWKRNLRSIPVGDLDKGFAVWSSRNYSTSSRSGTYTDPGFASVEQSIGASVTNKSAGFTTKRINIVGAVLDSDNNKIHLVVNDHSYGNETKIKFDNAVTFKGVSLSGEYNIDEFSYKMITTRGYRGFSAGSKTLELFPAMTNGKPEYKPLNSTYIIAYGKGTIGNQWDSWSSIAHDNRYLPDNIGPGSIVSAVSLTEPLPYDAPPNMLFQLSLPVITISYQNVPPQKTGGVHIATGSIIEYDSYIGLAAQAVILNSNNYTTSLGVNNALQSAAQTWQGSKTVKFSSNITLDSPIIVPPGVTADFTGVTVTRGPAYSDSEPYLMYFASTMYSASGTLSYNSPQISMSFDRTKVSVGMSVEISVSNPYSDTTDGQTILRNAISTYIRKVIGVSATGVTIDRPIQASSANCSVRFFSVSGSTSAGENCIVGGTWNVTGTNGSGRRGFCYLYSAGKVEIRNLVINGSRNADTILIAGCNSIYVDGVTVANNAHDSVNHNDAAAIRITNHYTRDTIDSSSQIVINKCSLYSKYGILIEPAAMSESRAQDDIRISNNTLIRGDITGIHTDGASRITIEKNNIQSTSSHACVISGTSGSSYSVAITSNTITVPSGTSLRNIMLAGADETRQVSKVFIKSNSFVNGVSNKKIHLFRSAYIYIEQIGITSDANVYIDNSVAISYAGSFSGSPIEYVAPTTSYIRDRVEVIGYKQWGTKITLKLDRVPDGIMAGEYVVVNNVHEFIDGSRRVIGVKKSTAEVVLNSSVSAIIPASSSGEYVFNNNDDKGHLMIPQSVVANKIVIKFDISYGTPNRCYIQVRNAGSWQTIYTMSSSSQLTGESELDLVSQDNIKTLTLYRDNSGIWSGEKSNFNMISNQNSTTLDSVRVLVDTTVHSDDYISVTEISARLQADLTDYTTSFDIEKELGQDDNLAPVGTSSANTGSIDLDNSNLIFEKNNKMSPFYGLMEKYATLHVYMKYGSTRVKLGTMIAESWSSDRDSASIDLTDKSIFLQEAKSRDIFIYKGNQFDMSISLKDAVLTILNSIGFGNVVFYDAYDLGSIDFIFTKEEQTPWEVLQSIMKVFQAAMYFDEVGRLHVMSKSYLYSKSRSVDMNILGANHGSRITDRTDYSGFFGGGQYSFRVLNNQALPTTSGATINDESLCTKIVKEPEFYVDSASHSGSTATLKLIKTVDVNHVPVNNAIYVRGLGSPFNGSFTIATGPTFSNGVYTITYSSGVNANVNTNNDYAGAVGYRSNAQIHFESRNLEPGKVYTFSGYVYIPVGMTGGFSVQPYVKDATNQSVTSPISYVADSWQMFSMTFTATKSSHSVGFIVNSADNEDFFYVYNDNVLYSDSGYETGYDEVYDAEIKKVESANKAIVKYYSVNPYSEKTTSIGSLKEIGRNAELWEMPNLIIPGMMVKINNDDTFNYNYVIENLEVSKAKIDGQPNNDYSGGEIEFAAIPWNGRFIVEEQDYEYEGLEALCPYATPLTVTASVDTRDVRNTVIEVPSHERIFVGQKVSGANIQSGTTVTFMYKEDYTNRFFVVLSKSATSSFSNKQVAFAGGVVVIKDDNDYNLAREMNLGIAPVFSGRGFLKKKYIATDDYFFADMRNIVNKTISTTDSVAGVPSGPDFIASGSMYGNKGVVKFLINPDLDDYHTVEIDGSWMLTDDANVGNNINIKLMYDEITGEGYEVSIVGMAKPTTFQGAAVQYNITCARTSMVINNNTPSSYSEQLSKATPIKTKTKHYGVIVANVEDYGSYRHINVFIRGSHYATFIDSMDGNVSSPRLTKNKFEISGGNMKSVIEKIYFYGKSGGGSIDFTNKYAVTTPSLMDGENIG